ncbi:threonine--tRNA ligase, partial [Candidatus Dependentiae bacterium]
CKGGHVDNTNKLKNFKLLGISGSYWRADRKGQPLQRITGTAFATPKELRIYEKRREEALKYDHRKLGRELDLFSFNEAGPGFPFFHPNGKIIFNLLIQYLRNLLDHAGYKEISTPAMLNVELWKQSGHYDHYRDNMYFSEIDETTYAVKPMNCPGAILIYKSHPHSYRELPLRLSEFGHVHRHELSGVLHGLFRVRSFTQDDAHVFCTPDQIETEIIGMVTMALEVFKKFDFKDIRVILSTKPDKAMGDDALWEKATAALRDALNHAKIPYEVHEGEGAFYGPKIDFLIKDSMDRSWQCSTVQLDFFQAENFDLWYVTNEGTKARPVIIHRALYGSLERFFGILIEHYKGKFPFWLAPTQIKVLSITDEQMPYAQELAKKLKDAGFRVVVDESSDPISGKIKNAQLQQTPWMLVVGAKEVEGNTITLRYRDGKQEHGLTYDDLLRKAQEANR